MPELSDHQFAGLFPADHPAMRERGHADMSTEQYRTLPGAYHHGTYRADMPMRSTGSGSAGIHLGTVKAAKERIDDMGGRNTALSDIHAAPDKPADIHTRRIHPEFRQHMKGSPSAPNVDLVSDWNDEGLSEGRGADTFGEHYLNEHEDPGSLSIRVPHSGYLESHRSAVDSALRSGGRVHPEAEAAYNAGRLDKPVQYTAGSGAGGTGTPYARYQQRSASDGHASENRAQGMLLPYKLQAMSHGPEETVPNPFTGLGGGERRKAPAVTFAASHEEARELADQRYKTVMGDYASKWALKTSKF